MPGQARRLLALAAICDGEELTYGELQARSRRLAHLLRAQGLSRGGAVGARWTSFQEAGSVSSA